MTELLPSLRQRYFDANGDPLAGGKLYSYVAGTTTPVATFTDNTQVTPNSNPVILDANGEASVWISDGTYKFVLADSSDVVQWTTDQVRSVAALIAVQINVLGSLAIANNLSDVSDKSIALVNLGIAPLSLPTTFSVTDGQAATNLTGESYNGLVVDSVVYDYQVKRGTTVFSNGRFSVQYKSTVWILSDGGYEGDLHGVTFSVTQVGSVFQLKAALDIGAGNGTIKLKKHTFGV